MRLSPHSLSNIHQPPISPHRLNRNRSSRTLRRWYFSIAAVFQEPNFGATARWNYWLLQNYHPPWGGNLRRSHRRARCQRIDQHFCLSHAAWFESAEHCLPDSYYTQFIRNYPQNCTNLAPTPPPFLAKFPRSLFQLAARVIGHWSLVICPLWWLVGARHR